MPFVKGQSGNPSGRPRKGFSREDFFPYAKRAAEVIAHLMETSKDDKVKLAAARDIVDRVLGKPVQQLSGEADGGAPVTVVLGEVPVVQLTVPEEQHTEAGESKPA